MSAAATTSAEAALITPLLAAVVGFGASFRMMRLPDPKPSQAAEGMVLG